MQTYKLRSDFPDLLGRAGYSIASFARLAHVGDRTIRAALNPEHYADRTGGVYALTAWKIARGYASATGTDEERAFALLFTEHDADPQRAPLGGSAQQGERP